MICSCFEGIPCELELELRGEVDQALLQWENFPGPSTQVAVAIAEEPLFQHRRRVQHAIYSALVEASDEWGRAEKEIPSFEAMRKIEALEEVYPAAKEATREVASWTRKERLTERAS